MKTPQSIKYLSFWYIDLVVILVDCSEVLHIRNCFGDTVRQKGGVQAAVNGSCNIIVLPTSLIVIVGLLCWVAYYYYYHLNIRDYFD